MSPPRRTRAPRPRPRRVLALALGIAAISACAGDGAPAPASIGQPAPAYAASQMDGSPVTLAEHTGEVVLLNIWATWCKPCREEIPALDSLYTEFAARGLVVAGVSIDVIDDTARIQRFARDLGATYPMWLDPDDRVSTTFRAIGVPATFLVDRNGVLRWRKMGAVHASDAGLRAVLDSALTPVAPGAGS